MRRIAVLGAGAVGGIAAWHLAKAGLKPLIVARPETARLISREGLWLAPPGQPPQNVGIDAAADPAAAGQQDLLLLGLKGQDLPAALPMMLPLIGPETIVVPMLNGIPWWYFQGLSGPRAGRCVESVDPGGRLMASIPAGQVIGCVLHLGGSRAAPNRIAWNGRRGLFLGTPASGITSVAADIAALLCQAGLDAKPVDDIRREVWLKLAGNAAHNPLSAAADCAIGHLVTDPDLRALSRAIMAEVKAVAAASGYPDLFDIEKRLEITPPMAGFRSSMLQDFDAGRPLELGPIAHAVIEIAALHGLAAPSLAAVAALASEKWRRRWAG